MSEVTVQVTVQGTVVCALDQIEREGGVLALVAGEAVAVFRTYDDQLFAISGWDPFSRACVLARGIMGTRGDTWFVASPMHKQAFDLRTGRCLDDAAVGVPTYDVWLADAQVVVGARREDPGVGP